MLFAGYLQELDAYALVYWRVISQNDTRITPWYYHFRLIWVLTSGMQNGRMLAVIICAPAASVQNILECISHLGKISKEIMQSVGIVQTGNVQNAQPNGVQPDVKKKMKTSYSTASQRILLNYRGLEIALLIGCDFIRTGMISKMATGFVSIVLFNFVALKMYGVIQMPFYLFYPICSAVTATAIQILLPRMISVYEDSQELIQRWKGSLRQCHVSELKYMTRKLEAVRLVKLHGGLLGFNIYALSKATRSGFNFEMLNYTITALLAVQ